MKRILLKLTIILVVLVTLDGFLMATIRIGVVPYLEARPLTPLMQAATRNDAPGIRRLIDSGADINQRRGTSLAIETCVVVHCNGRREPLGQTALMMAIDAGSSDAVKVLLAANADVSVRDKRGRAAIDYAMSRTFVPGGIETMKRVLQRGPNEVSEMQVAEALQGSVMMGSVEAVNALLPLAHQNASIASAMCFAAQQGGRNSLAILEAFYARLHRIPDELANCIGSNEALQFALDRGLDPNIRHWSYRTMMSDQVVFLDSSLAFHKGRCSCDVSQGVYHVKMLLDHRADPNLGEGGALSAVQQAVLDKQPAVVEFLKTGHLMLPTENGNLMECPAIEHCTSTPR